MHRKSGDGISAVDQAAISELEEANRAAAELIEKLSRQLAEGQRLAEDLKRDARNPDQKNGSISGRASYMVAQLQITPSPVSISSTFTQSIPDVESTKIQTSGFAEVGVIDTRDLVRLNILAFIDAIESDKDLKRDAESDGDLVKKLRLAIDVGRNEGALNKMMYSLGSLLGHSKSDRDCSQKYKTFKDSVLKNCKTWVSEADHTRATTPHEADEVTQRSIDKVTHALVKSAAINQNLDKDKFGCLINIVRGCKSEDEIDEKLFMVSRMFPKITKEIADVVRNNLQLYRVEGLPGPVRPVKASSSNATLFKTQADTPHPVRKTQSSTAEKKRPDRAVPPAPTASKK